MAATYTDTATGKSVYYDGGRYFFNSYGYVGIARTRIYRAYYKIEPPTSANVLDDYSKISKITLEYTIQSYNSNHESTTVRIGVLNSSETYEEETWGSIGNASLLETVTVPVGKTTSGEIAITNSAQIIKLMSYGAGMRASDESLGGDMLRQYKIHIGVYQRYHTAGRNVSKRNRLGYVSIGV